MASTANTKPFHTYENVGFDQPLVVNQVVGYAPPAALSCSSPPPTSASTMETCSTTNNTTNTTTTTTNNNNNNNSPLTSSPNKFISSNGFAQATASSSMSANPASSNTSASIAVNKAAIESPFPDSLLGVVDSSQTVQPTTAKILSATDSTRTTMRMLTAASASSCSASATSASSSGTRSGLSGHNLLVTKLVTFPTQSPMDSLKEWSLSTFKCTKQLINEKRGLCPVTSDLQLQNDIEQLCENREKITQMLRLGLTMTSQYTQLVRSQKQLHSLMNEMSIKCNSFSLGTNNLAYTPASSNQSSGTYKLTSAASKQVVANFSSLSNNLSSSTTRGTSTAASPTRPTGGLHHIKNHHSPSSSSLIDHYEDLMPVLNHMKTFSSSNLVDDFKQNAISLNVAIKNGEKLIAALNFYCANLSTLINKTIEDTLVTVKQYESARLEYDAEKNSLNLNDCSQPNANQSSTSMNYSSDKVELARLRYEQLREDVQIKMRFLEENTIKVMHKQLLLFNGAFASYTSGNTAALDLTLKQFSIKDGGHSM